MTFIEMRPALQHEYGMIFEMTYDDSPRMPVHRRYGPSGDIPRRNLFIRRHGVGDRAQART
ncbi:MAG: hypothetical protein P8Z41_11240 [Anaerolineales bacterium]